MKAVCVTWFDAVSEDAWEELDKARELELHTIKTIGWVVAEDERRIVVATSWDQEREAVAGHWAIPKTWLVDIQEIDLE